MDLWVYVTDMSTEAAHNWLLDLTQLISTLNWQRQLITLTFLSPYRKCKSETAVAHNWQLIDRQLSVF